jgi:hypothetical protein
MTDRIQYVYINSVNRKSGTASDFVIDIQSSLVRGEPTETLVAEVCSVVLNRSWYTIASPNNTFTISTNGVPSIFTFPQGYYSVKDVRNALMSGLPGWVVSYVPLTNTFSFRPPSTPSTTYSFSFQNSCCNLCGFTQSDAPSTTADLYGNATSIVSTQPAKVNVESAVLIHCDLPKVRCAVIDNLTGPFIESDILISLPVTCAPFDNLAFIDQGGGDFLADLSLSYIHGARFWITDERGNPLTLQYDWLLVLKLIFTMPSSVQSDDNIQKIADDLRLIVLSDKKISGIRPLIPTQDNSDA